MHGAAGEEIRESAPLYALGVLGPAEAAQFESHLAACDDCRRELDALCAVSHALAFAVPPVTPPSAARTRLARFLQDVAAEDDGDDAGQLANGNDASRRSARGEPSPKLTIRSSEGEWRELVPGVSIKQLFVDRERGTVTSLYRLAPGARVPAHRHAGTEECLVVAGDVYTDEVSLAAGDYHCAPRGSAHATLSTVSGALLLIVAATHARTHPATA